jgi:replicative DNA helicase
MGARPGMRKSAAALQIAMHATRNGFDPAHISLEVTKEAITKRLISQMSRVDSQKLRSGQANAEERLRILQAISQLQPLPFWIDDTRDQTAESIRLNLKRREQEGRIDLIIVDHFHKVKGSPREETRDRYSRIADTFQDLD